MTAEARVASRYERYFVLERKVMSPSLASLMPATPVIATSESPTSSPSTSAASSFNFKLFLAPLFFLFCVGVIQCLGDLWRQVTSLTLVNENAIIKNKRI